MQGWGDGSVAEVPASQQENSSLLPGSPEKHNGQEGGDWDLPAPCSRSNLIGELQANDNETPCLKGDGPCS